MVQGTSNQRGVCLPGAAMLALLLALALGGCHRQDRGPDVYDSQPEDTDAPSDTGETGDSGGAGDSSESGETGDSDSGADPSESGETDESGGDDTSTGSDSDAISDLGDGGTQVSDSNVMDDTGSGPKDSAGGCECSSAPAPGGALWVGLGLAALLWRRSRRPGATRHRA